VGTTTIYGTVHSGGNAAFRQKTLVISPYHSEEKFFCKLYSLKLAWSSVFHAPMAAMLLSVLLPVSHSLGSFSFFQDSQCRIGG